MKKILIIGQAPAAVKQTVPYDTTMLFDWLKEVNISKQQAIELFDFEAIYNEFPGYDEKGGHLKPSVAQMEKHWNETLQTKIELADKVWILGNVAMNYIESMPKTWSCSTNFLFTIHPSKRNLDRFKRNKINILKSISKFINDKN